jgi:hypothetical protein
MMFMMIAMGAMFPVFIMVLMMSIIARKKQGAQK